MGLTRKGKAPPDTTATLVKPAETSIKHTPTPNHTTASSEPTAKAVRISAGPTPVRHPVPLEARIGSIHFNQRLGLEREKEARVFGGGRTFFHIENWTLIGVLLKYGLRLLGLTARGKRNARAIRLTHNRVALARLPAAFEGYRILHVSDPHLDMADDIPHALIEAVRGVDYDICVFTGDFRGKTHGDFSRAIDGLRRVRTHLKHEVYAVLGNHDSLGMAPEIEALGIRVLLNEHVQLRRGGQDAGLYLAGIDDPHYYRADNFDKTAGNIPAGAVSILLAHSPEVYRHAAFANFDLMLCGHTHGGQICLPGGLPLLLNADCPRQFCVGRWRFRDMQGYTSTGSGACVLDVRFNCPPEITLHTLQRS
ncbi:metallophosphoesterase [Exilibacterium tricleocarpae]|uniref:Metallophosphoesterase n=1 Tax=Exilibacterium tricleocarpae TaxID=2591008 RepID=A0A545SPT4_9GAMM|nr:metallophosphoesterase [Exilibacterium tricleocarpae]TQV66995.1 metallophosphoesterase [Exilibacterium tricleocarpae]